MNEELIKDKEPASPWKVYRRFPRRCTVCGSFDIICDGRYFCEDHHPDITFQPTSEDLDIAVCRVAS